MARRKVRIEQRVANRVRTLRESQGISQAELARLAKTSRSQVAGVEGGVKVPTVATVESFARALGVPIEDLVSEDGGVRANPPDGASGVAATLRARGPEYTAAAKALIAAMDRAVEAANKRR